MGHAVKECDRSGFELLEPVRYVFENDVQPHFWSVLRFECTSRINCMYRVDLVLVGEDTCGKEQALLGQRVVLHLTREQVTRSFAGIVTQVRILGHHGGHAIVALSFDPAVALLDQGRDARVFQNQCPMSIVDEALGRFLKQKGSALRTRALTRGQKKLEYCVQYGETPLAFARRLMQRCGVSFFFVFDAELSAEVLVVLDDAQSLEPALNQDQSSDFSYGFEVSSIGGSETVFFFERSHHLVNDGSEGMHWDFSTPALSTHRITSRSWSWSNPDFDPTQVRGDAEDMEMRIRDHVAQRCARQHGFQGKSVAPGLDTGACFALHAHPDDACNNEFRITQIRHRGYCPEVAPAALPHDLEGSSWARYENEFFCVPSSQVLVPDSVGPKPKIAGPQTATVCGPSPGEIHVDGQGRVRLDFHWDRHTPDGMPGSCWVRVMQSWAGQGYGACFIPRVGTEVVVEFLDGDPERPLVTGAVYNASHPHPFSLPGKKSQCGIRTRSTEGGQGYSELSFEDQQGQEEVYLRSQRDLRVEVIGNSEHRVGGHAVESYQGDLLQELAGRQELAVGGAQTLAVQGPVQWYFDDSLIQEVGRGGTVSRIEGDREVVSQGTQTLCAKEGLKLRSSEGGASLAVKEDLGIQAKSLQIRCGDTKIEIDASGAVKIDAGHEKLEIKGSKILLNNR